MNILICTGIYPPDIGGPAEYAKNIAEELILRGNDVAVASYNKEKKMPVGIRHIFYFFKILPDMIRADLVIALDTFSVGLPAVFAAKLVNRKIVVRVAGDFLWESYIGKSGDMMTLKDFYDKKPELSFKQKLTFSLSEYVFNNCSALVFSTDWQKEIISENYDLKNKNLFVVENFYGEKIKSFEPKEKNYIFAGRPIRLKNLERLKTAFAQAQKRDPRIKLEIISKMSHAELAEKMRSCYAVILPSLSDISPNFILDAIRADKPFILTKETGFYDKLGGIGVFIDPSDTSGIVEKILFLADDKNYAEYRKRVSGFKFTHSWKEITDNFLEIYKNL
ncbi:MAG: glycosyltransferase family 4 protein [bacterium]|nr:glycosyltransferase family 4 protein [bacterium]